MISMFMCAWVCFDLGRDWNCILPSIGVFVKHKRIYQLEITAHIFEHTFIMEGNVACAISMCAYCLHNAENTVVLLAAILSKKERLNIILLLPCEDMHGVAMNQLAWNGYNTTYAL